MPMTEEDLALLTDEERAGLEGDEDIEDGEEDAGDSDESADAGAAEEAEQPGRDDGADPDEEPEEQPEEQPVAEAPPVPLIKAEAPADVEAKLADIDQREDALSQQFEDGDLTTAEYRAEVRKLEKERGEIERAQFKAELAQEMEASQVEALWQRDVQQFLATHPDVKSSELRMQSFDLVVRQVTAATMQEGKHPGMADLQKAYQQWTEALGLKAEPKPEPKEPKPKRELPPTLAKVPAAAHSETDDGKWAHLDRLMESDPIAYEKALAKLSAAETDAYLASQ